MSILDRRNPGIVSISFTSPDLILAFRLSQKEENLQDTTSLQHIQDGQHTDRDHHPTPHPHRRER